VTSDKNVKLNFVVCLNVCSTGIYIIKHRYFFLYVDAALLYDTCKDWLQRNSMVVMLCF